jgi:signal transduction histidine kinase/CheY-like chemotaxis protein
MSWGYVTTWTDITERARATGELAAANERLEERVRERTIALTTLNEALSRARAVAEDANLGKTRFLAAASHDLLQPLNAARLYASTLLERHAANAVPDLDLARKIDASLRLVEDLLGTLLDISRLDGGALKPERRHFPLDQLFDSLKMEFAPLAERKGLDLRIVPTSLAIDSDRHLLHRVLQNLLSNALRYTQAGKVLLGARRAGSQIVIQVWDTGSGIPLEYQGLVFEEFRRFGPETERGLGLGLSIVDRISRILDHPVTFRSRPGHGTGFSVRVPRGKQAEAVPPVSATAPRALPNLEQAVVLCVDDQVTVLDSMRALLEGWSCRVLLARGLVEAVALASAESAKPELLIVDFHLDQSGDGIDCVDALRRAYDAHLPAVLVTADRSETVRIRAFAHGISVLHKPLKPAALRAVLMRLLATRQTEEQRQLPVPAVSGY